MPDTGRLVLIVPGHELSKAIEQWLIHLMNMVYVVGLDDKDDDLVNAVE